MSHGSNLTTPSTALCSPDATAWSAASHLHNILESRKATGAKIATLGPSCGGEGTAGALHWGRCPDIRKGGRAESMHVVIPIKPTTLQRGLAELHLSACLEGARASCPPG